MLDLIINLINATPDAWRFTWMDAMEAVGLMDNFIEYLRDNGRIIFEDGSIK